MKSLRSHNNKRAGGLVFLILVGSTLVSSSLSFTVTVLFPRSNNNRLLLTSTTNFNHVSLLYAKKQSKKQNKKKTQNSGGGGSGFGAATTAKKIDKKKKKKVDNDDDDYALFPALEPQVSETIVPADPGGESISPEIYARLEQIYGLADFNYQYETSKEQPMQQEKKKKEESSSLSDLLSSTQPSSSSSLESLLLGEDIEPSTTTTTTSTESSSDSSSDNNLHLDQLPAWKEDDFTVLHVDPLVLSIRNFFTHEECDRYRALSDTAALQSRSPTVGKDAAARAQRTSTTWYHYYESVPELMAKASRLLGLAEADFCHWEEAQTVRYRPNEKFTWHLDALGPDESVAAKGGQRIATLLVYLTDLDAQQGGATMFRDLKAAAASDTTSSDSSSSCLSVRPLKGSALLFFPAAGGIPNAPFDVRTLHCGQVVANSGDDNVRSSNGDDGSKWIAQLWLRQGPYTPTAPSTDNLHDAATAQQAIAEYCTRTGGGVRD